MERFAHRDNSLADCHFTAAERRGIGLSMSDILGQVSKDCKYYSPVMDRRGSEGREGMEMLWPGPCPGSVYRSDRASLSGMSARFPAK